VKSSRKETIVHYCQRRMLRVNLGFWVPLILSMVCWGYLIYAFFDTF